MYFILGDPQEAENYLTDVYRGNFSFDPETTNAICMHQGTTSWIWFDKESISVSILVHELSHAVFDLMDDVGLEKSDQEAFCYLIEYLIDQCQDIFAIQMGATNLQSIKEVDQVSS